MPVFQNSEEMMKVVQDFAQRVVEDGDVAPSMVETGLCLKWKLKQPEGVFAIDFAAKSSKPGEHFKFYLEDPPREPNIVFTMKSHAFHEFWMGKLSFPKAIATRSVVLVKGNPVNVIKLLPKIKPYYAHYGEALKGAGREVPVQQQKPDPWMRWLPFLQRLRALPRVAADAVHAVTRSLMTSSQAGVPAAARPQASEAPVTRRNAPGEYQKVKVDIDANKRIQLFRTMVKIRRFEEAVKELFAEGTIPGFVHLYIGEEAVATGACAALRSDDWITSTHRGHGHCIAKGAALDKMMAELYGKQDGLNRGKGGSIHLVDCSLGILGANGIVAAGAVLGSGAALAEHYTKTDKVCICFLGDDATNQGMFHEAANFAAARKLPLIFVCENNGYGISVPMETHSPLERLSDRAAGYAMPGVTVDGMDPEAVFGAVNEAVTNARAGRGPSFIECLTYRFEGHMEGDAQEYRTEEEVEEWRKKDPISTYREQLIEGGVRESELSAIEEEIGEEVKAAIAFAEASPDPDKSVALEDVYAPTTFEAQDVPAEEHTEETMYITAINEALSEELERDDRVFLLGEDQVHHNFGVTTGLSDIFPGRLIDTPISENAIVGGAVGAAMAGLRPVAELMFFDFATCAMDPLVNQAAKLRYFTGGQVSIPMVVRTAGGGGMFSAGAQHSQCLEALFMHIPGIKVAVPATPYDAKGLLKAAIRDDNPVLFVESKGLYFAQGTCPKGEYVIPFGKADVKRSGTDVTVVAIQDMVPIALDAASDLESEGIQVEVVDPRTLVPLDMETILSSVEKTSRLIITEMGVLTGGVGAEIAATVANRGFDFLDAPIMRVATPDVPIPFGALEAAILPDKEKLKTAIREACQC